MNDHETFSNIKKKVIDQMNESLSSTLTYHNVNHTLDVIKRCEVIFDFSSLTDKEDLLLLKLSALYHDLGFIDTYDGHENRSIKLAQEQLPPFGFNPNQIATITSTIEATKRIVFPKTPLQKIICDADLDYLGRDDFSEISKSLFLEYRSHNKVKDEFEWNKIQFNFFQSHEYYTTFSQIHREPKKRKHLEMIKDLCKNL